MTLVNVLFFIQEDRRWNNAILATAVRWTFASYASRLARNIGGRQNVGRGEGDGDDDACADGTEFAG